jgi:parvulin-like peptidyl-prolyl isomerase
MSLLSKFAGALCAITLAFFVGCKSPDQTAKPLTPSGGGDGGPAPSVAGRDSNADAPSKKIDSTSATRPTPPSPAVGGRDVIATVDNIPIAREALVKPLIEGYGLSMLAKVAQLEVAKQQAIRSGVVVSPGDVTAETDRYVGNLFNEERDPVLRQMNDELEKAQAANDAAKVEKLKDDLRRERSRLLDQLLQQQKVSRADFNIVMETNTYLRKIAETMIQGKITEENLHQAFGHLYGEKVRVRDIALANLQEVTEAKRRLASGEDFATVAREISRNQQTAALGGEIPPFSRETPNVPQEFKDVAFTLKNKGDVSDAVSAEGAYHLIQLIERIPPKIIKFEDVRDSVKQYLYEAQLDGATKELRARIQQAVANNLKINDPELRRQFEEQVSRRDEELKDRDDIRREWERRRAALQQQGGGGTTRPSTEQVQPSSTTMPTAPPTTSPATAPAGR